MKKVSKNHDWVSFFIFICPWIFCLLLKPDLAFTVVSVFVLSVFAFFVSYCLMIAFVYIFDW